MAGEKTTNTNNQALDLAPVMSQLNIIRGETVLSSMPIHNLSKKGKLDIQITQKRQGRKIYLKWEVSYSDRYGQPRALAYKLDTLIINRRIEQTARPLPELIALGSLREIAEELGHGGNTAHIKNALRQNAAAFISANIKYLGTDGGERTLDASFSRYGVIFTGERLPDGRKADGVYITLNPPYRDVLNNAPWRPLNYDYLKELPPGPQRLYEIVSFRIFAALKYGHDAARLNYSDYCVFSAQTRYFEYEQVKKQMYKIHVPHKRSGYIKEVTFSETRDGDGKADWVMVYTPGPAARAEYEQFTRKRDVTDGVDGVDDELLAKLVARDIAEGEARRLLQKCAPAQPVADQIEWVDHLIATSPAGKFPSPAGFLFTFIERNLPVPHTFETTSVRRARAERELEMVERERAQSAEEAAGLADAAREAAEGYEAMRREAEERETLRKQKRDYEPFLQKEVGRYYHSVLSRDERARINESCTAEMDEAMPQIKGWTKDAREKVLWSFIERRLREEAPLPTFEEYVESHWREDGE